MGRRRPRHAPVEGGVEALTAFVDTNVLVRHLTGVNAVASFDAAIDRVDTVTPIAS